MSEGSTLRREAPPLSAVQLLGLDDTHVVALASQAGAGGVFLHPQARGAFEILQLEARAAGFDLQVASGYRSFRRQVEIWNGKARGEREVLDAEERPIDIRRLSARDAVAAILRWSALPGCSRHHWGTDIDVYDAAALAPGEPPRLRVADWNPGGCFAALGTWLGARIAERTAAGFFRPYTGVGCAVAAEPWHLSYAPLAARCQVAFDPASLRSALSDHGVELFAALNPMLDDILARYVDVPAALYPMDIADSAPVFMA